VIEAYGKGGFRFADMSHRGSILCLPQGIWASDVKALADLDLAAVAPALADGAAIDHFLIGTGKDIAPLAPAIRDAFRGRHIVVEPMSTGAAVRTYNILLGERRRVGALLIAVE
jgi:uncharacterized protein